MIWKFDLPLLSRVEIFSKIKCFVEVIWKFELPLLSPGEFSSKYKAVLLKWFENLNCPYHHELNFGKNMAGFISHLKIRTGPIIMS